jgi:hypothetical protein
VSKSKPNKKPAETDSKLIVRPDIGQPKPVYIAAWVRVLDTYTEQNKGADLCCDGCADFLMNSAATQYGMGEARLNSYIKFRFKWHGQVIRMHEDCVPEENTDLRTPWKTQACSEWTSTDVEGCKCVVVRLQGELIL